jgi:hypothetical protein
MKYQNAFSAILQSRNVMRSYISVATHKYKLLYSYGGSKLGTAATAINLASNKTFSYNKTN